LTTKLRVSAEVRTCLQLFADSIEPFRQSLNAEVKVGLESDRIVVVTHVRTQDGLYSSLREIYNAGLICDRKCETLRIGTFRFEIFDLNKGNYRDFPDFQLLNEVLR
jgi:hypothetical protein